MSYFQFNKIVVVESLGCDDRGTSREIFNDLEFVKISHSNNLKTGFEKISKKSEFLILIEELVKGVEQEGVYPVLHIDAHGNEDGVRFSGSGFIEWKELLEKLAKLNVLMKGNLLVVLASCHGAHIIRHIENISRAPFWGVIAPYEKTYPDNVYTGLYKFYNAICSNKDTNEIISSLNVSDNPNDLKLYTAELLFVKSAEYAVTKFQHKEPLKKRIKSIIKNFRNKGGMISKSEKQLKTEFLALQKTKFDQNLRRFLLVDLFPENINKISKLHNPWNL